MKLYIKGEYHFITDREEFFNLVEEFMGEDAVEFCREYLPYEPNEGCECDKLYKLQEHYENVIKDVLEELKTVRVAKCSLVAFEHALQMMRNET